MAHNYVNEYWRFRADVDGLNSESSGWLAAENTAISHGTGIHVRLRMKVRETGAGGDSIAHKLQFSRNAGAWTDIDQDGPNALSATAAVLVESPNFSDAASITTEYLTSTTSNVNGEGIAPVYETNVVTGSYAPNSEEIEFEWNIKILNFFDSFEQNVAGDILQFRMVESGGTIYSSYATLPQITITETDYYIGGTVVETPNRLLNQDTNGNLYYLIEPSETQGDAVMIKSTDGGRTWREMDDLNRPLNGDIESGDIDKVGDTLHIAIQHGSDAYYHRFHMSDHSTTPDTWAV